MFNSAQYSAKPPQNLDELNFIRGKLENIKYDWQRARITPDPARTPCCRHVERHQLDGFARKMGPQTVGVK
jgi:hypothetical protein